MEEIPFKGWNEFRSYIDEVRQVLSVYWRGQKDPSWVLASRPAPLLLSSCVLPTNAQLVIAVLMISLTRSRSPQAPANARAFPIAQKAVA